jgi:uncharacterized protein
MSENNKAILAKGNAAIVEGNNEGFLSCCADDTEWTFVGDKTLKGKEAVRQYMAATYIEPPKFTVTHIEGRRRDGCSLFLLRCLAFSRR